MSSIMIRKMAENDLEKVLEIEKDSFSEPWSVNAFRTDIKNDLGFPLVAEFEDTIVGYTNLYIVAGEVQIGNFAVASGFRQRGVGKKLMAEIVKTGKDNNCDIATLEVRDSNDAARQLYKSFGFADIGTRKNYYSDPQENAVIMTMEL